MNKGMNILYQVHNNLYVNLTNRCPCACTFCLRQTMDSVAADDATLWLEHDTGNRQRDWMCFFPLQNM